MEKLKIGVLGYANIAKKAIIPAILESNNFELTAIATSDFNKIEEIKKTFSTIVYNNYEDLINDENIKAIYIPLPNSLHYEWVKKCLEKSKHVLVEKSLASTAFQVVELCEIARQKNLALIENFQFRFHKQLNFIIENVNNGSIGAIRNIRSTFCFPPFEDKNNIRYKKQLGGGALLDAGAYPIKLSQIFLGHKIEVAHAQISNENEEVDIWGNGTIKQTSGNLILQFSFGFDNYYQCNLEILGSNGKIIANRIFTAPPGFNPEIIIENNQGKNSYVIENENHFKKMLLHFYNCINDNQLKSKEINQNIIQAKLINQFIIKSNG